MGCRCGKNRSQHPFNGLTISNPQKNSSGMYDLESLGTCDEPYSGVYRSASIYVVGHGTDKEMVFARSDATAAVEYAKEHKLKIGHIPARQVCHEAMIAFFGA
jgi:hypothetical protein